MSDERNTGGGANVEGDANTQGGDLTGRDRIEQNVHIYPQPDPRPARRPARRTGKLMPDEAAELRQSIDSLRVTMTRLEGTVDKNNALTIKSMDALQEQVAMFKAQVFARAPVWVAYLTVTLLGIIAMAVTITTVYWITQR